MLVGSAGKSKTKGAALMYPSLLGGKDYLILADKAMRKDLVKYVTIW